MSRATILRLSVTALVAATLGASTAFAQTWTNPQQALGWQSVQAPFTPRAGAVAGGPGDSPEPGSPMFICRAPVQGSLTPGKWVKGACNVAYDGREVVARDYEIAYGRASWRPFGSRNDRDLIQTGHEANGTPLYSCRARYSAFGKDLGYQPGKIIGNGECHIAYGGRMVNVGRSFEALYAGNMGAPGNVGATGQHQGMPLCRSSDPGVLMKGRTWSGPNCIPVDVMTNQPVPVAQPRAGEPRPLCHKGDPGVTFTAVGYAGPDCVTTNAYGEVAAYGNASPEERAHYRETMEACQPGDAGVHVENGMLVGADCKSVPEPVARTNSANDCTQSTFGVRNGNQVVSGNGCISDQQRKADADAEAAAAKAAQEKAEQEKKAAEEQAAAEQRAAGEAEELRMAKDAEAKAQADKAAQEQAEAAQKAAEQKAAEEKAAAEQRAAGEAEELRMAKEAEAKAEADKAAQEQAEAAQKAAEQKAAEEQAAAEQRAAGEAQELQEAKEAEAKAEQEKAEKEQADREKLEQLQKAFQDQAEKDKSAEPEPDSSGNPG